MYALGGGSAIMYGAPEGQSRLPSASRTKNTIVYRSMSGSDLDGTKENAHSHGTV